MNELDKIQELKESYKRSEERHMTCVREKRKLKSFISKTRGQWIHSVHKDEGLAILGELRSKGIDVTL